jgi:hypothetical protein
VAYVAAAESVKRAFYRHEDQTPPRAPTPPHFLRAPSPRSA